MHVAMHNWMRAEPIEVTVARLAKCGYDAIEISGEPERYDTKAVGKLLKDHGLTCWGSVTLMLGDRNLLASNERNRAMSVKYVKDTITMVKELGGQEITIVPCTVGKLVPEASPSEEWQWAVESLQACYAHGMKEGIRLALEPLNRFETYFLNRHDQALRLAIAGVDPALILTVESEAGAADDVRLDGVDTVFNLHSVHNALITGNPVQQRLRARLQRRSS
jgi:sugar phosphate isomerase/epimerase